MPTAVATGLTLEHERLYAFGASVELDGRTSWTPDVAAWQPMQSYVLVEGEDALILDPGPAIIGEQVARGVADVVPSGTRPPVFLTRYQLDGIGNLAAIAGVVSLGKIYSGGVSNPFDSFDQVTAADGSSAVAPLQVERIKPGGSVPVGAGRELLIIPPKIRILTTFWAFDTGTRTLFTSDSFTHVVRTSSQGSAVVTGDDDDPTTVADVQGHLLATFPWLAQADMEPIIQFVVDTFEGHDVHRIAPSRGCVIAGPRAVARHRDLMIEALNDIGGRYA